ncbi:MAG: phosphate-starvation-inducible PsiE family protein [Thiohalorhabdus sp.]
MGLYERFEQVVALVLVGAIAVVVLVALWDLLSHLILLLGNAQLDPLDPQRHGVFQEVFSGIMTLLIAMEFKHSILRWAMREDSIIQVKTVLAIGLLALARKFIILDLEETSAAHIVSLALAVIALGAVYWLIRERDDRKEREKREREATSGQGEAAAEGVRGTG